MVSPEVLIASIKSQTVSAQKRCRVAQGLIKYMMLITIFQTKTTSYFIYEIFVFYLQYSKYCRGNSFDKSLAIFDFFVLTNGDIIDKSGPEFSNMAFVRFQPVLGVNVNHGLENQ